MRKTGRKEYVCFFTFWQIIYSIFVASSFFFLSNLVKKKFEHETVYHHEGSANKKWGKEKKKRLKRRQRKPLEMCCNEAKNWKRCARTFFSVK